MFVLTQWGNEEAGALSADFYTVGMVYILYGHEFTEPEVNSFINQQCKQFSCVYPFP